MAGAVCGVGNENWGCGGNMMAETYAAVFRQVAADVSGWKVKTASARTLHADRIDRRVEFDAPDPFVPVALEGIVIENQQVRLRVPAGSVTMLSIQSP